MSAFSGDLIFSRDKGSTELLRLKLHASDSLLNRWFLYRVGTKKLKTWKEPENDVGVSVYLCFSELLLASILLASAVEGF